VASLRLIQPSLPALLLSAETSVDVRERAAAMGLAMQAKPASAQGIEGFLASVAPIKA